MLRLVAAVVAMVAGILLGLLITGVCVSQVCRNKINTPSSPILVASTTLSTCCWISQPTTSDPAGGEAVVRSPLMDRAHSMVDLVYGLVFGSLPLPAAPPSHHPLRPPPPHPLFKQPEVQFHNTSGSSTLGSASSTSSSPWISTPSLSFNLWQRHCYHLLVAQCTLPRRLRQSSTTVAFVVATAFCRRGLHHPPPCSRCCFHPVLGPSCNSVLFEGLLYNMAT
jgi:hypothetical protein